METHPQHRAGHMGHPVNGGSAAISRWLHERTEMQKDVSGERQSHPRGQAARAARSSGLDWAELREDHSDAQWALPSLQSGRGGDPLRHVTHFAACVSTELRACQCTPENK